MKKAQRVFFTCPKIVGYDFDMSKASVYINFENANGEKDAYRVEDLNVNEELEEVTFSWLLSRKVTACKGQVNFIVCAKISNENGIIQQEWNTTVATAISLVGLEAIAQIEQENYDILEEILRKVKNIEENGVDVDLSAYQKKTDNELKTNDKTIVGAINEIKDNQRDLPIASSIQLGGVKPVDKTSQMTENIGVDSQGRLYRTKDITEEERTKWNRNGDYNNLDNKPTIPKEIIVDAKLNETSTNAIQNQAVAKELAEKLSKNGLKTINGQSLVGSGNIELSAGDNDYELPIANNETLGGVKPVAKTDDMTQEVGVDESGLLFTVGQEWTELLNTTLTITEATTHIIENLTNDKIYNKYSIFVELGVNTLDVDTKKGKVDIVINNAKIGYYNFVPDTSSSSNQIQIYLDTKLKSLFQATRVGTSIVSNTTPMFMQNSVGNQSEGVGKFNLNFAFQYAGEIIIKVLGK